jgi:hypothetical protein
MWNVLSSLAPIGCCPSTWEAFQNTRWEMTKVQERWIDKVVCYAWGRLLWRPLIWGASWKHCLWRNYHPFILLRPSIGGIKALRLYVSSVIGCT